jgi:cellulose synthase/poly-beta-1,6-N-acetylglucosamine synthase-like glycosyltransferase
VPNLSRNDHFREARPLVVELALASRFSLELAAIVLSFARVTEQLPSVTVLIAARPGQTEVKAVAASQRLDYPAEKLEILVARGRQPSAQRNTALHAARGDLIYFLDDDSLPAPDNLRRAAPRFADPAVQMVGGPNLCPPEAPPREQVFALVLGSWLAFGPSRARYVPVGAVRVTSEKELILCNLIARRQAMLDLGGFNEALYPNEENALMDDLQKRGGKLLYDPAFIVQRRPRPTLKAFVRMLLTYGRGRAEQFRVNPTLGSALNFVPPLFCLYLLGLGALPWAWPWLLGPLALYLLAVLIQAAILLPIGGVLRSVAAIPLIILSHVMYGLGFWRGMFLTKLTTPQERTNVEVVLERIAPRPQSGTSAAKS